MSCILGSKRSTLSVVCMSLSKFIQASQTNFIFLLCSQDFHGIISPLLEVPDPPKDVMVFDMGALWLALQWTPTFDGNQPITSFVIYQQNINITSPFVAISMLRVGSLTFQDRFISYNISDDILPFNNYQFAVQACNVLGCGNVSAPSPTAMTLPDSKWIIWQNC